MIIFCRIFRRVVGGEREVMFVGVYMLKWDFFSKYLRKYIDLRVLR